MEKKREARKKRDMEQRYVMQRAEMEKRKKLEVHAESYVFMMLNVILCSRLTRVEDRHFRTI